MNVLSHVITKLWVGGMLCSLTQQMSLRILTTPLYWPFGAVTKCPSGTDYFNTQGQGLCYNLQDCFASSLWVCGVAEYHSGEGTAERSPWSHLMGLRHKKCRGRRRGLGDEIRSPSSPPCNWDPPPKLPQAPNTLPPQKTLRTHQSINPEMMSGSSQYPPSVLCWTEKQNFSIEAIEEYSRFTP